MKAILAEAVNWYVRLHDSDATDTTHSQWQAWLAADSRHAQAWARLEQLQQRLGQAPVGAAMTLENARQNRRMALKTLALLLGVGVVGWQGYRVSPWSADYVTRVGQRRQLTLADGSRLDLNTDTQVDIRFDAEERLIHLRHGEILLDTAKDPRPLSVLTTEGRILALGTRFCVRQDAGLSRVSVTAHAVEVRPRLTPQKAVRVDAGQSMSFTKEQHGPLLPMATDAEAWTRAMLVTVDWRLADVIAELSRYRPGYLGCAAQVADLRLSGAFNLDNSDEALANLEDSLPVRVRRLSRYWARVEPHPAP